MPPVFSSPGKFFKKYLSPSSIKVAILDFYKTTSDKIEKVAKRDNTKAYSIFASYVFRRILRDLGWSWVAFAFMLTYKSFSQAMSLYIEGWSGTMTIEFESAWLLLAIKVAGAVFIGLLAITIRDSIYKIMETRRKLEAPTSVKDSKEFVTEAVFEQFGSEVEGALTSMNERLDDIETILKDLVEDKKRRKKTR